MWITVKYQCISHQLIWCYNAVDGRSLQYFCIQLNVNLQISTLVHGFSVKFLLTLCIHLHRSVDELTTFDILRWVNNVFHILLKICHIIVWFGPIWLEKSTPSFRIYDMIHKYAEMSFWSCVYNSKNVCCQSHYTNMATSGCDVYLLLYFMPVRT